MTQLDDWQHREPVTGRYADMAASLTDLRWVREQCARVPKMENHQARKQVGVQVDAIVRYGRCFQKQRNKFQIPGEWVEGLTAGLRCTHTRILAAIDNRLEDVPEGRDEADVAGLEAFDSVIVLKDLTDHFIRRLRAEMNVEALALTELARRTSFC